MCSTLFIHFLNLWFFWLELDEPDFWEDHSLRVGPGSSCIFTLGEKKKVSINLAESNKPVLLTSIANNPTLTIMYKLSSTSDLT